MKKYTPSGKHPHYAQVTISSIIGSILSSLAGFLMIFLFLKIALTAADSSQSEGISFINLVIVGCEIWLIAFVPFGMGYICGFFSSFKSRNPKVSTYFAIGSAILTIYLLVRFLMYFEQMTFSQWLNLSWATLRGVKSGFQAMSLLHLIPIIVLIFSAMYKAQILTNMPYCEKCNTFCKKNIFGILPEVKKGDSIDDLLAKDDFTDQILIESGNKVNRTTWAEPTFYLCNTCNDTGFITINAIWVEKDNELKKNKEELCSHVELRSDQILKIKERLSRAG